MLKIFTKHAPKKTKGLLTYLFGFFFDFWYFKQTQTNSNKLKQIKTTSSFKQNLEATSPRQALQG